MWASLSELCPRILRYRSICYPAGPISSQQLRKSCSDRLRYPKVKARFASRRFPVHPSQTSTLLILHLAVRPLCTQRHSIRPVHRNMAGPPVRERYNSKARGSTAGGGSHKKRKRPSKASAPAVNEDGEGEGQADGVREETREKLPMEGEGRGGMSAKKRKRMDSYIVCLSDLHSPLAGTRPPRDPADRLGQEAQDGIPARDTQTASLTRAFRRIVQ